MINIRDNQRVDWHTSKENALHDFGSRISSAYLANSWRSDMAFYVEQDDLSIPAHSFVVAIASPVLERFCFDANERVKAECLISVPNCSAADFYIVLRYIYNGGIGAKVIGLSAANAAAVLLLADFYDLRMLSSACVEFLSDSLTVDNVCAIYDQVHLLSNKLTDHCLQYMQRNTSSILKNGSAMRMGDDALGKLLAINDLCIAKEEDLFLAMINWADAQWKLSNNEVKCSAKNRRSILKDRLLLVRFAAMPVDEFARCVEVAGWDLFTATEISTTVRRIACKNSRSFVVGRSDDADGSCTFSSQSRVFKPTKSSNHMFVAYGGYCHTCGQYKH